MCGKRAGEWVLGGILGCLIALVILAIGQWMGLETPFWQGPPPVIGQKLPHEHRIRPDPNPSTKPAPDTKPAPVPDRNEIQLPLHPVKKDPGPLQVAQPPPPPGPNDGDEDGVTPFMRAAGQGDIALLEKLLEQGAEVNQTDFLARTALYYAIVAKSAPTVEWLIAHGAMVDYNCVDGTCSPLLYALETGELSIIELILKADPPIYWCRPAREALYNALHMQNKPFIRALLANHRTPPTLEGSEQPLLGFAIAWGNSQVVGLLLECGANPNTPLNSPVGKDFSQCIADKGLREYLETETGMTPLMLAAAMGRQDCVEALVQYGAKRSVVTKRYRMTAIDFAARRGGNPAMLQVLLGKSARPEDQRMHINVSIAQQRAVFYKDGQVALVTPISTGRPGFPTPTGEFVVTDKDRMHRSTLYPAYMPYFLRMSCRDFGLHAGDLPGYPASHGCIRLPWGSAERLYREVDIGTLVTITR